MLPLRYRYCFIGTNIISLKNKQAILRSGGMNRPGFNIRLCLTSWVTSSKSPIKWGYLHLLYRFYTSLVATPKPEDEVLLSLKGRGEISVDDFSQSASHLPSLPPSHLRLLYRTHSNTTLFPFPSSHPPCLLSINAMLSSFSFLSFHSAGPSYSKMGCIPNSHSPKLQLSHLGLPP